jgi:2-dehydro-3-deoxyphosphooctonate aldolase (KDO 8-P synthase)
MTGKIIDLGNFKIGNTLPITIIAGPCQMESRDHALECVDYISALCRKHHLNFIFKTSFDKANRLSVSAKRGLGMEKSLPVFAEIKKKYGCPVLTDVHTAEQCSIVGEVVDILQTPALLCRQTDLLLAAGETGKIVNIKKGQFMAPWDMAKVAEKVASTGNDKIMLTERGITFGYNRLVNDMRAIPIMAQTGYPVVFDATHSIQEPGGLGTASGGQREFVQTVSRAAVAIGVACLFIETHPDPDNAPSDGPCMIPFTNLESLLKDISAFDALAKKAA